MNQVRINEKKEKDHLIKSISLGDETRSTISDNWSTMNAGVSDIDGQEQAVARLNEIVEELPIIESRRTNELVLPENVNAREYEKKKRS